MSRVIDQGVVVTVRINNVNKAAQDLEDAGRRGQNAFGGMSSTLATVQKALISMVGVLAAWTVFITIPEKLASAFKELAVASVGAAAEMERSFLALAGLLASFRNFGGKDIAANFVLAQVQAEKLLLQFQQISAGSLASAQDLLLVYQTLVSRGGLEFVKTQEDALKLTRLLADTILVLTGGQQKERQLVSETSALFEGQARAGALLAKIVAAQVGDLKTWVAHEKQSKTLLEDMQKIFGGMNEASSRLANTLEGIVNSIKGQLLAFNVFANRTGALQDVLAWLTRIRNILQSAINDLNDIGTSGHILKGTTEDVLKIFGFLSASIQQTLAMLNGIVVGFTGGNTQLEQAVGLSERLAIGMTFVRTVVDAIVDGIKGFMALAIPLLFSLTTIGGAVKTTLGEGPLAIFSKQSTLALNFNLFKQSITDAFAEMRRQSLRPSFGDALQNNLQQMQDQMKIAVEGMKLQFNRLADVTLDLGKKIRDNIVIPTKEEINFLEKFQDEFAKTEAKTFFTDIFRNSFDKALENIREIQEHLKNQPKMMKEAFELNLSIEQFRFRKDLNDFLEKYNKNLEESIENEIKQERLHMENNTLLRVKAILLQTNSIFLKDLLNLSQSANDASQELGVSYKDLLSRLKSSNFNDSANAFRELSGVSGNYSKQIRENNRLLDMLHAKHGITIEDDKLIDNAILRLQRDNERLNETMREMAENIRQSTKNFESLGTIAERLVIRVKVLGQSMREALGAEMDAIIKSLANSFQQMFANLVSGVSNTVPLLKKLAASVIDVVADIIGALGRYFLAMSAVHFLTGNIGQGAKYAAAAAAAFAAAGLLHGLAQRIGGTSAGSSAGGGGASGSALTGNDRQVIFEPTANFEVIRNLKDAVAGLQDSVANLKGISPGQVVAMGVSAAGRQIATVVRSEINSSPTLRRSLNSAILGEAS